MLYSRPDVKVPQLLDTSLEATRTFDELALSL
jgi:hypothetical protein